MTWVRLDDEFPDHKKVAGLSNDAFCLHVTAMCWVAKWQTDGKLPGKLLGKLAWRCQDPASAANELVAANVWEITPEGWEIHDFSEYNPTKEKIAELAATRSEAGKAGAMARWQNHSKPNGKSQENQWQTDGKKMPPFPFPLLKEEESSPSKSDGENNPVEQAKAKPRSKRATEPVEQAEHTEPTGEVQPKTPSAQQGMFGAIADVCHVDPVLKKGQIAQTSKAMLKAGYTSDQVRDFTKWWKANDFRGKQGQVPTIGQLTENMLKFTESVMPKNGSDPAALPEKEEWTADYGEGITAKVLL